MSAFAFMWWCFGIATVCFVIDLFLASANAGEQSMRQYERLKSAASWGGVAVTLVWVGLLAALIGWLK